MFELPKWKMGMKDCGVILIAAPSVLEACKIVQSYHDDDNWPLRVEPYYGKEKSINPVN